MLQKKESNRNLRKIAKNIYLENEDESQESPLVIIISWSSAKLQYLFKYADLYKDHKCTIVYVLQSISRSIIYHTSKLQRDCIKLDDFITEQTNKNQNRKIIFHLFSVPGPAILNNLMNYYFTVIPEHINCLGNNRYRKGNNNFVPNISGIVYDSCILNRATPKEFGRGTKAMTSSKIVKPFFYLYGNLIGRITPYLVPMYTVWCETLKNLPGGYPQLIVFSKIDPITSYEEVLELIKYRKDYGEDIDYRLFEDSKHVNHLRKYPSEYSNAIDEFMKKVDNLSYGRKVWKSLDGLERDL